MACPLSGRTRIRVSCRPPIDASTRRRHAALGSRIRAPSRARNEPESARSASIHRSIPASAPPERSASADGSLASTRPGDVLHCRTSARHRCDPRVHADHQRSCVQSASRAACSSRHTNRLLRRIRSRASSSLHLARRYECRTTACARLSQATKSCSYSCADAAVVGLACPVVPSSTVGKCAALTDHLAVGYASRGHLPPLRARFARCGLHYRPGGQVKKRARGCTLCADHPDSASCG